MRNRRGQTILEYTLIVVIILGVMIAMKDYVKRGIQGRWKSATDDFGDQYDPQSVNSITNYATQVQANTIISTTNAVDAIQGLGQWTNRVDTSDSVETKVGFTQVGD